MDKSTVVIARRNRLGFSLADQFRCLFPDDRVVLALWPTDQGESSCDLVMMSEAAWLDRCAKIRALPPITAGARQFQRITLGSWLEVKIRNGRINIPRHLLSATIKSSRKNYSQIVLWEKGDVVFVN